LQRRDDLAVGPGGAPGLRKSRHRLKAERGAAALPDPDLNVFQGAQPDKPETSRWP
jgi:hypothetical protein